MKKKVIINLLVILLVILFAVFFIIKFKKSNSFNNDNLDKEVTENLATKDKILQYFENLPLRNENKVILGQFVRYGTKKEFAYHYKELIIDLESETGKKPGIIGINIFDINSGEFVEDPQMLIDSIMEYWDEGMIAHINLIPPNPEGNGGLYAREVTDSYPRDLALVYTEGTPQNTEFKKTLDKVALFIEELEKKEVIVLFEPINEIGLGKYWYSWDSPEKIVELYDYTYDYMVKEKQLSNVIWVVEFIGGMEKVPVDLTSIKDKIDVIGLSIYDSNPGDKYQGLINDLSYLNKPIAFSEFGPDIKKSPDESTRELHQFDSWDNMILIEALEENYPEVVFVTRWASVWSVIHQKNAKQFMEHSIIIDSKQLKKDMNNL